MEAQIDIPDAFIELVQPSRPWRHYCYHGGRSSTKSTTVGSVLGAFGTNAKKRILCCREVQNSIAESVHKLLADQIIKYKLPGWEIARETIRNRNGSEFIFKGLRGNAQSIKSLEGIDICWVEEAQTVSTESIDILIPTIRKQGSFFIWTFNRLAENDPVWERVAGHPDERTYVRQVNSDEVEALLSPEIIAEREKMRKDNPELFAHVWLGQPLTVTTGSIYGKQLAQAREEGRIGKVPYDGSAPVYAALDLGVGDSTAICFFQTVGQEIHFIDYYESAGEDLAHYISVLANKPWEYRQIFLPHDARARELQTGKTREEFFRDHGYANVTILRPSSHAFGQDDINMVARPKFSRCWFDQEKCARLLECLAAYHYEYDEKNKLLKDRPKHDWSSHAADAFIYSLIAETEQVEVTTNIKFKTFTPKAFSGEQTTGF
ncbi:PBSX family phage terminase large subunit [Candidatus Saccharibacteria bacterium]|nr:PBSX family phage terminase large subunit [Candidatus Saccharibacteria bacterium]